MSTPFNSYPPLSSSSYLGFPQTVGITGATGPAGSGGTGSGPTGPAGPTGATGPAGTATIPATGTFSWISAGTGTFINLISGTGSFTQLSATGAAISSLSGTSLNYITSIGGTGTLINLTSGTGTFTQLNATGAAIASLSGTSSNYITTVGGTGTFINLTSGTGTFVSIKAPTILGGTGSFVSLFAATGAFTNLSIGTGSFTNLNVSGAITGGSVSGVTGLFTTMSASSALIVGGTGVFNGVLYAPGGITGSTITSVTSNIATGNIATLNAGNLTVTGSAQLDAGVVVGGFPYQLLVSPPAAGTGASLVSIQQGSGYMPLILNPPGTNTTFIGQLSVPGSTTTGSLSSSGNVSAPLVLVNTLVGGTGFFTALTATGASIANLTGTNLSYGTGTFITVSAGTGTFGNLSFNTITGGTGIFTSLIGGTGVFTNLIAGTGSFSAALTTSQSTLDDGLGNMTVGRSLTINQPGASKLSLFGNISSSPTGWFYGFGATGSLLTYNTQNGGHAWFSQPSVTAANNQIMTLSSGGILSVVNAIAAPTGAFTGASISSLSGTNLNYGTGSFVTVIGGTGTFTNLTFSNAVVSSLTAGTGSFINLIAGTGAFSGQLSTSRSTLDDTFGNMSVGGQLNVGNLTGATSKLSLFGNISNPTGWFYGFGATGNLLTYASQGGHSWYTQTTNTGLQQNTLSLGSNGSLGTIRSVLDDGFGNMTIGGRGTGSFTTALNVLNPNMTTTTTNTINLGRTNNNSWDCGQIIYKYNSAGSNTNTISLNVTGGSPGIIVAGSGVVTTVSGTVLDDASGNMTVHNNLTAQAATLTHWTANGGLTGCLISTTSAGSALTVVGGTGTSGQVVIQDAGTNQQLWIGSRDAGLTGSFLQAFQQSSGAKSLNLNTLQGGNLVLGNGSSTTSVPGTLTANMISAPSGTFTSLFAGINSSPSPSATVTSNSPIGLTVANSTTGEASVGFYSGGTAKSAMGWNPTNGVFAYDFGHSSFILFQGNPLTANRLQTANNVLDTGTGGMSVAGTLLAAAFSGPLNGTVGQTTPAAGTFSSISGPLNGTVGATTPAAGAFTTLSATSGISATSFQPNCYSAQINSTASPASLSSSGYAKTFTLASNIITVPSAQVGQFFSINWSVTGNLTAGQVATTTIVTSAGSPSGTQSRVCGAAIAVAGNPNASTQSITATGMMKTTCTVAGTLCFSINVDTFTGTLGELSVTQIA